MARMMTPTEIRFRNEGLISDEGDADTKQGHALRRTAVDLDATREAARNTERRLTEALKAAERERDIGVQNIRELWSALRMIRETVETLGDVGAMPAGEHLPDPTPTTEAEAIVAGIMTVGASVRAAAIEEAAKVADMHAAHCRNQKSTSSSYGAQAAYEDEAERADTIAADIRNLTKETARG